VRSRGATHRWQCVEGVGVAADDAPVVHDVAVLAVVVGGRDPGLFVLLALLDGARLAGECVGAGRVGSEYLSHVVVFLAGMAL